MKIINVVVALALLADFIWLFVHIVRAERKKPFMMYPFN